MEEKIYSKNKIIGELIHRKEDKTATKVIRTIQKNFSRLRKFFGFTIPQIKIHLLYSRAKVDKIWGAKTPNWICGFTKKNNTIYMLSPLISGEVSGHPEKDMRRIVIHEIVHLFIKRINKNPLAWVNEGVALFLANQKKSRNFKESDWQFFINRFFTRDIDYRSFAQHKGYVISYWLVKTIAKKFGRKKLIDLIKFNP